MGAAFIRGRSTALSAIALDGLLFYIYVQFAHYRAIFFESAIRGHNVATFCWRTVANEKQVILATAVAVFSGVPKQRHTNDSWSCCGGNKLRSLFVSWWPSDAFITCAGRTGSTCLLYACWRMRSEIYYAATITFSLRYMRRLFEGGYYSKFIGGNTVNDMSLAIYTALGSRLIILMTSLDLT